MYTDCEFCGSLDIKITGEWERDGVTEIEFSCRECAHEWIDIDDGDDSLPPLGQLKLFSME